MTSIQKMNTMGFDVVAKHFYEINSLIELDELIEKNIFDDDKFLILGGGSNILFSNKYFDGTIIHSNLKGIIVNPNDDDDYGDGSNSLKESPEFQSSRVPKFLKSHKNRSSICRNDCIIFDYFFATVTVATLLAPTYFFPQ